MSFPSSCPKCQSSLVGAKILIKGDLSWAEFLAAVGSKIPPDKIAADVFYGVAVKCPGCNASIGDFLLGDSRQPEGIAHFNRKRALYEAGDSITAEMCVVTSHNVTFVKV